MGKEVARTGLDRLQAAIGLMLLASAASGVYLLATDRSLWLLALSHAVGLVLLVALDLILGVMSLATTRSAYLPSMAVAVLGLVLQLGDIATAPQYDQTVVHFASYLFGLWAYDLILALQVGVMAAGLLGRRYAVYLARRRTSKGRELEYDRRGFLKSALAFTGLVGAGVALSSLKLPIPSRSTASSSTTTGAPSGAIANANTLEPGRLVYFRYPSGHPNVLFKNGDGTLTALSLLCTHVCCDMTGYVAPDGVSTCPCHGSVFDSAGRVIQGPAVDPLPVVTLRIDGNGYVFPTGVANPGPCQA